MLKHLKNNFKSSVLSKKELLAESEVLARKVIQLERLVATLKQEFNKSRQKINAEKTFTVDELKSEFEEKLDEAKWALEIEHLKKINSWERKYQELENKYQELEHKYQSLEKKSNALHSLNTNIRRESDISKKRIENEHALAMSNLRNNIKAETEKEKEKLAIEYLEQIRELNDQNSKLEQKCENFKKMRVALMEMPEKSANTLYSQFTQKISSLEAKYSEKYNELEAKYKEVSNEYSKLVFKPETIPPSNEVQVSGKKIHVSEIIFECRRLIGKVNSLTTKDKNNSSKIDNQKALLKKQERLIEQLNNELEYKKIEIQKMNESFINTRVKYDLLVLSLKLKSKQVD